MAKHVAAHMVAAATRLGHSRHQDAPL